MSLGTNIRETRKSLHLTQADVAERIGVSFETVSGWETDKYSPSMENLQALAQVLETSTDKLLGKTDWTFSKRLFDEKNMAPYLKAKLSGENWKMSAAALEIAKKFSEGTYRDKEHEVAYINHPLTLACQAFAMGVAEDGLVAALLLHDVVEDNRDTFSLDKELLPS